MPSDFAGNTLATARDLTLTASVQTLQDYVGPSDLADYYHINLTGRSSINLSLDGLSADADLELLGSDGSLILRSDLGTIQAEAIATTLNAGDYYIRVYPYGLASTNYSLNASATPLPEVPLPPAGTPADWTVMVYLSSDNLERYSLGDFLEMAQIGSSANVNIVVQLDRTAGYDSSFGDWTDTRRGRVLAGDLPTSNWGTSLGEVNMGDANSLGDFVSWGMNTYQANNYALVVWGHGSGTEAGFDDITGDAISANELSTVLARVNNQIDLVAMDACLMAGTEYAYAISNQAEVFVASEELIPGTGYDYRALFSSLTLNPAMTTTQLGSAMVNSYQAYYGTTPTTTLSAINLREMGNLTQTLNQFAQTFMATSTMSDRRALESHRLAATSFENYDADDRDLGRLMQGILGDLTLSAAIRTAAQAVLTAYNTVVVQNYSQIAGYGTGLAIDLQARGTASSSNYGTWSSAFAANTSWDEFQAWWQVA
jgi:hypothetical protein